jgi:hypothetical protein
MERVIHLLRIIAREAYQDTEERLLASGMELSQATDPMVAQKFAVCIKELEPFAAFLLNLDDLLPDTSPY